MCSRHAALHPGRIAKFRRAKRESSISAASCCVWNHKLGRSHTGPISKVCFHLLSICIIHLYDGTVVRDGCCFRCHTLMVQRLIFPLLLGALPSLNAGLLGSSSGGKPRPAPKCAETQADNGTIVNPLSWQLKYVNETETLRDVAARLATLDARAGGSWAQIACGLKSPAILARSKMPSATA